MVYAVQTSNKNDSQQVLETFLTINAEQHEFPFNCPTKESIYRSLNNW